MTSERVIQANRRNAQASTGPRTTEGKARSGQNAQRHGLTARKANLYDSDEIERLADLIAAEAGADPMILEAARAVAETQTHLRRVQAVKSALIQNSVLTARAQANENDPPDPGIWADLLKRLERLERYERRAFSRRKTAIRQLDKLARRTRRLSLERDPE